MSSLGYSSQDERISGLMSSVGYSSQDERISGLMSSLGYSSQDEDQIRYVINHQLP
jgi:hypothetical protein